MSCSTTLFYGIWVTTKSLRFAAMAHDATRGPFMALELSSARRSAGKLELGESSSKLKEVPQEVWEMVKQQLILTEARDAETDTVQSWRCGGCAEGRRPSLTDDVYILGGNQDWKD